MTFTLPFLSPVLIRRTLRLTPSRLARRAGVAVDAVHRLESGKRLSRTARTRIIKTLIRLYNERRL